MPSRKQKRRRDKDRRHEYEYVYVDDSGDEVEVDEPAAPPRGNGSRAGKQGAKATSGRPGRKVEPPSWRRVGRRALLLGPVLLILMYLLKPKDSSSAAVIVQAVFFLLIFLPFSYLMDSMLYRSYLRRSGQAPTGGRGTKEPKAKA